jgi:DNA-binding Lrp family transcriptional regulator
MAPDLDPHDLQLLAAVQRDARTPQASLGARIGLSAAAVNRRLRRLTEAGVITKVGAVLAPERVGHPLTVITQVAVNSERVDLLDAVRHSFVGCRNVQQCYYVTGEWDFVLVFAVKDMDQYTALTRELFFSNNNVRRFTTSVVMSRAKVSLEVPL